MLLVKTETGPSLIHGTGLFAAENIKSGQIVWKYDDKSDLVLSYLEWYTLDNLGLSDEIFKWGTIDDSNELYIDMDNCRYMNHYEIPNVFFIGRVGVAMGDIIPGSELLCDYRQITKDWHFKKLLGN